MQLVEPVHLLPPSICIICEGQPDGEAVVDTLRNFKPGVPSVLNGRKYVCERCVGELAKLFGYEIGDQVQRAQFERDAARRDLATVRARIDEFSVALADVVNHPGLTQGANYDDVFQPSALDQVRTASASRAEQIKDAGDDINKPTPRRKIVRAAVPNPGLDVNEGAPVDNVAVETKEFDGSSRPEK